MSKDYNKNEMVKEDIKETVETSSKKVSSRFDETVNESSDMESSEVIHMSAVGKLINIVLSPSKALKAIKHKPTIWAAMIALPILPLLYYLICWQAYEIQMIQMLESQFAGMGMELTRDILEMQLNIMKYTAPGGAVVGTYFGLLIPSVFYFLIGKLMKKNGTFKQTFSLMAHTAIIASLIWLMHIIITLALGESNILAPMTSLASLLPADMYGSVVYGMLSTIEVFSLWYMFVLYMGLHIVLDYSKKAAAITVVATLVISMLITAGSLAITNMAGSL